MASAVAEDRQLAALETKMRQRIDSGREQARKVLGYVEDQGQRLQDYIWPLGQNGLGFYTDANGDRRQLMVSSPVPEKSPFDSDGIIRARMHEHAVAQATERLDLPGAFLKGLAKGADWQIDLAARILQEHNEHMQRQRTLVRVVGDKALAMLSDHYKRLDSMPIVEGFAKTLEQTGAEPYEATWEETRFSIKALLPQVFTIPLEPHGMQYLAFGVRLRSSDFGDGALYLSGFTLRVVCMNLLVMENSYKEVHLGVRLPDDVAFSDRTYRLNTQATESAVRDMTKSLTSSVAIQRTVDNLQLAAGTPIDAEEWGKSHRQTLSTAEAELLMKTLAQGDPTQIPAGPTTKYRFAQALSWVANETTNERRKADLQELAGSFLKGK